MESTTTETKPPFLGGLWAKILWIATGLFGVAYLFASMNFHLRKWELEKYYDAVKRTWPEISTDFIDLGFKSTVFLVLWCYWYFSNPKWKDISNPKWKDFKKNIDEKSIEIVYSFFLKMVLFLLFIGGGIKEIYDRCWEFPSLIVSLDPIESSDRGKFLLPSSKSPMEMFQDFIYGVLFVMVSIYIRNKLISNKIKYSSEL